MSTMIEELDQENNVENYKKCKKDIMLLAREQDEMEEAMISISEKSSYMRFHAYEHTSNLKGILDEILSYDGLPLSSQVNKFASTVQSVIDLRRDPMFDAFGNDKASTDDNSKAEKDIYGYHALPRTTSNESARMLYYALKTFARRMQIEKMGKDMNGENLDEDIQKLVENGSDKIHGSFDDTMRTYATIRADPDKGVKSQIRFDNLQTAINSHLCGMDTHEGAFHGADGIANIATFAEKVHKNYLAAIRTTWKDTWCNEPFSDNAYNVNDFELVKRAISAVVESDSDALTLEEKLRVKRTRLYSCM